MEGTASISSDIVARYAGDAARDVRGVAALVESRLPPHRGVRVSADDGRITVEIHLRVDWDVAAPEVAEAVQERVRAYLRRMANVEPAAVDVVVAEVAVPA